MKKEMTRPNLEPQRAMSALFVEIIVLAV